MTHLIKSVPNFLQPDTQKWFLSTMLFMWLLNQMKPCRPHFLTCFPLSYVCHVQSGQFSEDMIPTVGFNMRKVTKGNVTIKVSQKTHRQLFCFQCSSEIHLTPHNAVHSGFYSKDRSRIFIVFFILTCFCAVLPQIWDIGGQPRFRSMWERYCRGVNAIV